MEILRNEFNASTAPTINGFRISGGNQSDFPGNVNAITGAVRTPYGAPGAAITLRQGAKVIEDNRRERTA